MVPVAAKFGPDLAADARLVRASVMPSASAVHDGMLEPVVDPQPRRHRDG